jgi:DNA-binding transcriptional MerR regulator
MGFYTSSQAARLARLPLRLVRVWRRKGIIVQTIDWESEEGELKQGYSYEGLIFLRLIRMLREENVPLRRSVIAVRELRRRFGPPGPLWEEARIFHDRRDVFVYGRDEWGTTVATRNSQRLMEELFGEEFRSLKERTDDLLIPSAFRDHVEIDPRIHNGLPIIFGTAVTTSLVHSLNQQGLIDKSSKHRTNSVEPVVV